VREAAPAAAKRLEWLARLERRLDVPMMVLGLVWLGLMIWQLTGHDDPWVETAGLVIWGVFVLDFAAKLALAPRKGEYLARNWLTVVSLFVPALRFVPVLRVLGVMRGLRLVRVVGSLGRGMRVLGASLDRRGFGYVAALTLVITFGGAAGMYAFEHGAPGGLGSYPEALWWTAMVMTTMGSQYWPQTFEGRVLCLLLALYAFTIFGYVTAVLATLFVEHDTRSDADPAQAIQALRAEIAALRLEIVALRESRPR
jgi:voltage-gated potassium channel